MCVPLKVEENYRGGGIAETLQNFGSEVTAFFSHSLSNAPMAANLAACPVILYSPGTDGHRRELTDKAEDLASWGYVVVGLDASDTYVSVFPDGTVVYGGSVGSDPARVQDMQFVMGQLADLNAGDPRLSGRLDLDRIGAIGWSWGGGIAEELCLCDSRCKAAVGFEPGTWVAVSNLLTQPLNVPYLFFRSDYGPDPDTWWSPDGYADERLEAFDEQKTNAYYVKLASTVHGSFCDADLIDDSASMAAFFGTPMSGQFLASARVSQIVRAYLLSFFNKFLKGQDNHLLDGPSPAYPEVIQFLSASSGSLPPEYPSAGLVQGNDGSLYGTTAYGGASGNGTVFRVTTNGVLTILLSFNGTNGSHPVAALVQGSDGNFYGTTACGGTNGNNGTVFQVTPAGVLTTMASFSGTNGRHPAGALVQGADGNFYGTTLRGGADGLGTAFQMTPAGTLSRLVSFTGANGPPFAGLVQGTNGSFYGTTSLGGSGCGTVFEMTPAGRLTTLVRLGRRQWFGPVWRAHSKQQRPVIRHNRIRRHHELELRRGLWHGVQDDPCRGVDDSGRVQRRGRELLRQRFGSRQRREFLQHNGRRRRGRRADGRRRHGLQNDPRRGADHAALFQRGRWQQSPSPFDPGQ